MSSVPPVLTLSSSCTRRGSAAHRPHRTFGGPLGARSNMAGPHRTVSSMVRIVFPEPSGSSVTHIRHGSPAQSCSLPPPPSLASRSPRGGLLCGQIVDRADRSRRCQTSFGHWPYGNSASPCLDAPCEGGRAVASLCHRWLPWDRAMILRPLAVTRGHRPCGLRLPDRSIYVECLTLDGELR